MALNGQARRRGRNAGPSWGFGMILFWDRVLPSWLVERVMDIGAAVACLLMKEERRHSRDYLHTLLGCRPGARRVWRHFRHFTGDLVVKLRAGEGANVRFGWADAADGENGRILGSEAPLLLGTFHVGASDLLGFHLRHFGRVVSMVRTRVGNSRDLEMLERQAGPSVRLIWTNDPEDLIFALKASLEKGESVAMQCDRTEGAPRGAYFPFLGAERFFPLTIYRLANLFDRPVLFCVAVDGPASMEYRVKTFRPYEPGGDEAPEAHFRMVLAWLEELLRDNPYLWYNFRPLPPSR